MVCSIYAEIFCCATAPLWFICTGMATQLGPMYLLEIVPFNLKGAFGTACQLFCTIGIFVGSVFGLREILGKIGS